MGNTLQCVFLFAHVLIVLSMCRAREEPKLVDGRMTNTAAEPCNKDASMEGGAFALLMMTVGVG